MGEAPTGENGGLESRGEGNGGENGIPRDMESKLARERGAITKQSDQQGGERSRLGKGENIECVFVR